MPNLSQAQRVRPYHYHCDMASRYRQIAFYALYVMIPAIIYSKALITVCYAIMVVMAIMTQIQERRFRFNKKLGALSLIGVAVVISVINSADVGQWWHHVVIKLPFLIIPFAFMALGSIPKSVVRTLHLVLVVVLSISALPLLLDIIQNHEQLLDRISRGQAIDTPIEHVKYSMFLAYGVVSAFIWRLHYSEDLDSGEPIVFVIGGSFLFLMLHLLAVRTGLVITYAILALFGMQLAWSKKLSIPKVGMAIAVTVLGVFLLAQIPMIQHKLGYMFYDWQQYVAHGGINYSDSERLFSLKTGWDLFCNNLLLGTGMGDLYDSCVDIYQQASRTEVINYPHSQYVYQLAGTGIIGFLLFIGGYLYPLRSKAGSYYLMLIALYLNYSLSFLVENSFERSISVAFFLIFAVALMSRSED